MKTRCKDGDIALVVHDIPECAQNIGRLVRLSGPLCFNREYRKHCWLVQPLAPTPYAVDYKGEVRRFVVLFRHLVEHPDDWMIPVGRHPERADQSRRRAPRRRDRKVAVSSEVEA